MALKESAFVLWVIYGLLGEKRLADRATALKSLGYGRWQCLRWLVLPALLPALGMVLLAPPLEPVGGRRRPGAGARQSAHPRRAGVAMVKPGR